MEIEILYQFKNKFMFGISDGIYYIHRGFCWEEIPGNNEKEAIKFCEEIIADEL